MGVAELLGVSETGEFIEKLRITHDLSFPAAISNQSVNSRVNEDELEPCMFGKALQRSIHHIVILRQRHPDKRIWLRKEDFKSAYRRMHLRARTAKRTGVKIVIDGITYILIFTYTSQYAPKVALSCLQSGFGLPSTMAAGLNVCDIPSLCRKAFNQPTMSTMFSSTISLGAFLYGSSTQHHLTRSLSVLMDRSTRGTCSLAAQISTCGPTSPSFFLNSLSALIASILNPRFS